MLLLNTKLTLMTCCASARSSVIASVLDIIAILTDQPDYKKVRNEWKWLKNKRITEGSQLVGAANQLKLRVVDGKFYKIGVVGTEQILRPILPIVFQPAKTSPADRAR
jgi:hypothetical protein